MFNVGDYVEFIGYCLLTNNRGDLHGKIGIVKKVEGHIFWIPVDNNLCSKAAFGWWSSEEKELRHVLYNKKLMHQKVTKVPEVKTNICNHEYINVGFTSITMACRHCGCDQISAGAKCTLYNPF